MNKTQSKWRWAVGLALALTIGMAGVAPAQGVATLTRQVLGAGGASVNNGNVTLASTLGQPFVGSGTAGNMVIGQGFWVGLTGKFTVFLPATLRNWPPVPAAPTLYPISNPNGLGNYIVSWSGVSNATAYILEEASSNAFTDAQTVYSGANTSFPASGRGAARYHYRVKAHNSYGDGGWSNVQSVDVRWEHEPNNGFSAANGSLVSGLDYYGYPQDAEDWYFMVLPSSSSILVQVTNYRASGWLQVYDQNHQLLAQDEHVTSISLSNQASGKYYIRIYTNSRFGNSVPYTLKVVY